MLKKLLKDMLNQKGIYLLLIIGILWQTLLISLPYITKFYIDFIVEKNLNDEFYFYVYLGISISLFTIVLSSIKEYIKKGIITKFEIEKNIYYFKKFFSLDYEYRNDEGTGQVIKKINLGIDAQTTLFNSFFNLIINFFVRVSLIFGVLFTIYKPFIGIIALFTIFLIFLNKFISDKIRPLTDKEQEINEEVGRQTTKMIMESNLINIYNKGDYEIKKLLDIFTDLPLLRQKIYIGNDLLYTILHIFFNISETLVYVFLGVYVINNQMTFGELITIVTYIRWMWWPIEVIINNISEYRSQISKYEALDDFINQQNKIIDGKEKFELKNGEIIFKNVDFSYLEEKNIFKDFCLKIDGGKTLALVGHSGSGKTTLIKLILRNYLVDNGKILIDGQDLNKLKISTFYENIGYLSQEASVFDGTIKENLAYGLNSPYPNLSPQARKEQKDENENIFWEVLKKVDLFDLIKSTKDGLKTQIGEKGLKLSGGERQRLAIARIFLKNPKILILDEPTSALDSISENKITKIINDVMKTRTVIIIAHRLQTVLNANKIVVIEKGKIIETGTHNELLNNKGVYASLVDLQKGVINE